MTPDEDAGQRYVFLDYLRALAAWLVVWDHLANVLPRGHGLIFRPAELIHNNFTAPLGIIQDFGWFGVALFLLISGFIISDRARVEGLFEFSVKRLLRIYPMLIVAVLLACVLVASKDQVAVRNVLLNMTLANYLMIPQVALVGVAWTLVIEMAFYVLTALTQFARNSPHRIALNLVVAAVAIWKPHALGENLTLLAVSISYLPILVMGQTIYWWLAKGRLTVAWGLGYLAAAYVVLLMGVRVMQPQFATATNSYLVSVGYALLLFVCLLRARLPEQRIVRFLSDTSYSMYLMHGIVGWALLSALMPKVPLAIGIPAAAAASLAASWISYRLVERPTQRLARRLTRGPATPTDKGAAPIAAA